MKGCLDCERCRVLTSLGRCRYREGVNAMGDYYVKYHTADGVWQGVPMPGVGSDEWNSPLCWTHRNQPHVVTDRVFPTPRGRDTLRRGIYPSRGHFEEAGLPMVMDCVRVTLVNFEPPAPLDIKRRRVNDLS
jgi:hypothetical protein